MKILSLVVVVFCFGCVHRGGQPMFCLLPESATPVPPLHEKLQNITLNLHGRIKTPYMRGNELCYVQDGDIMTIPGVRLSQRLDNEVEMRLASRLNQIVPDIAWGISLKDDMDVFCNFVNFEINNCQLKLKVEVMITNKARHEVGRFALTNAWSVENPCDVNSWLEAVAVALDWTADSIAQKL